MRHARSTLVLLAAIAGAACSDDDETTTSKPTPTPTPTPTPAPAGQASVRVVHASPDAPAVDVYVEGQATPVVTNAKYGDASPYVTVPPGSYNFQIRPAGAPATSAAVYSTGPVALGADSKTTAIAAGLLNTQSDAERFRVLPLTEGFQDPGAQARVRVVHASPDAPTVGIDVGNDNPASPEIPTLDRFTATPAEGASLPPNEALQVGITASGARVTAFTTPALPPGGELFVIATGLVGKLARENEGFSLLAVGPEGAIGFVRQNPVLYALHASPDAPAVDLFAGPLQLADNLAFGQLSQPIQVPPATYRIDFFPTTAGSVRPADPPAATASTPELAPGQRYLATATGFLLRQDTNNRFTLVSEAEGFNLTEPSKAVVRLWHASPDTPVVDVGPITQDSITPVFTGLTYPLATDVAGTPIDPATIPIGVTPTRENNNIVARFTVPFQAGARAFGIAAGASQPQGNERSLRLLVVNTQPTTWTVASLAPEQ